MAKNKKEIEAQFKADTSQFTEKVDAAGKEILSLTKELKLNKTQMKNNSDSVELLTQRQSILSKESEASKNKIDALESKLDVAKKTFGENSKEVYNLQNKITDAKNQFAAIQNEIQDTDKKLDSLSNKVDDCSNEFDSLSNRTDDSGNELEKLNQKTEKAKGGFTVLKGVIANLISDGISKLKESISDMTLSVDKSASNIQAALGLTDEAAEHYREIMKNIYNDNFGESMSDVASAIILVKENLSDIDDKQIQGVTEKAITLRDTFDMDLSETLRGVNGLITNMGLSADEAFNYITVAAQNGLNKTDELGDNLAEYSQLWGQAGFSAEQMFAILDNGLDNGAYNLDKVNDFVKEFTISLADGRVEENISSFSRESQNLFSQWQSGKATSAEVFQSIINDLGNTKNSQEALTTASNIWSALGEDNALKVITSLTNTNNTFAEVKGSAEELADVQYDNLSDALGGVKRELESAFQGPLDENVLPALNETVQGLGDGLGGLSEKIGLGITKMIDAYNWGTQHKELLIGIGSIIGIVALALGIYNVALALGTTLKAADTVSIGGLVAAKWAENAANIALAASGMAALGPILLIVAAIAAVIAIIVIVVKHFDEIKAKGKEITEALSEKFTEFKDKTINAFKAIPDAIKSFFDGIKAKIKVPKISVSYSTDGVLGKVADAVGLPGFPKLNITWNKDGHFFTGKTLEVRGYAEAGDSEYALPLNKKTLDPLAAGIVNHMDAQTDMSDVISHIDALYNEVRTGNITIKDKFIDAVANRLAIKLDSRELGRVVRSY